MKKNTLSGIKLSEAAKGFFLCPGQLYAFSPQILNACGTISLREWDGKCVPAQFDWALTIGGRPKNALSPGSYGDLVVSKGAVAMIALGSAWTGRIWVYEKYWRSFVGRYPKEDFEASPKYVLEFKNSLQIASTAEKVSYSMYAFPERSKGCLRIVSASNNLPSKEHECYPQTSPFLIQIPSK